MAEEQDDPFKEFGGSVITKTQEDDPFAEFGGKRQKKNKFYGKIAYCWATIKEWFK